MRKSKRKQAEERRAALLAEAVAAGKADIGPGGLVWWKPGQEPRSVARAEFENALRQVAETETGAILKYLPGALEYRIYHSVPETIAETLKAQLEPLGWAVRLQPFNESRVTVFVEKAIEYPSSKPLKMQMSIERPTEKAMDLQADKSGKDVILKARAETPEPQ